MEVENSLRPHLGNQQRQAAADSHRALCPQKFTSKQLQSMSKKCEKNEEEAGR